MPITSDPNVPLDNKQLRVYDRSGNYTRVSVDEAIARGLNNWKGWKCSAGSRGLYIDYDGHIWVANCASSVVDRFNRPDWKAKLKKFHYDYGDDSPRLFDEQEEKLRREFLMSGNGFKFDVSLEEGLSKHWGYVGNIYEGFDLPTEYITCPFNSCGCGADVILSKYNPAVEQNSLQVTTHGLDQTNNNEKYVSTLTEEPVGVEMNFPIEKQILWDLGRRCNYDCSYCWPSVHNNRESWKDTNTIINTIDLLVKHWGESKQIRWNFGGGEPTMHPDFLEILQKLNDTRQWVLVTTNGSRSSKFWKQAAPLINTVNMSAHFESMDKIPGNAERFIDNCKIIMEHHDEHDDDHWIEIKLMTPPGKLDRALEFKEQIQNLGLLDKPGANGRMKGVMSLVPIRDIKDSSQLVKYSDNEIEFFKNQ